MTLMKSRSRPVPFVCMCIAHSIQTQCIEVVGWCDSSISYWHSHAWASVSWWYERS